ncbi:MAG: CDGSH iron-sulfur domain-containing protein [Anaerolineae bacterium]|nr:CDGSH iron-sulfur domain-containing protein [Anaerolineae bacterium]
MAYRKYEGSDITVQYDVQRCIHAAECVNRLRAVFDTEKRPWIQPDNASAQETADVIQKCPSGALLYESKIDSVSAETPDETNSIQMVNDGPLYVRGDIHLKQDGETQSHMRLALCRCGQSGNKPYCDNSHIKAGFPTQSTLAAVEATPAAVPSEPLEVEPYKNGPIGIKGAFRLLNMDQETVMQGEKGALCRCGNSGNKPFCDGTHSKINFQAP